MVFDLLFVCERTYSFWLFCVSYIMSWCLCFIFRIERPDTSRASIFDKRFEWNEIVLIFSFQIIVIKSFSPFCAKIIWDYHFIRRNSKQAIKKWEKMFFKNFFFYFFAIKIKIWFDRNVPKKIDSNASTKNDQTREKWFSI